MQKERNAGIPSQSHRSRRHRRRQVRARRPILDGRRDRPATDKSGRRALRNWLLKSGVNRAVFEPTGRYHRNLHECLADAGPRPSWSIPCAPAASPKRSERSPRTIASTPHARQLRSPRRPRGHTAPAAQPPLLSDLLVLRRKLVEPARRPPQALRRTRPRSRQLPLRHARGRPDRHCRVRPPHARVHRRRRRALPPRRRHPVHPRLRSRQRRLPLRGHARARLPRPPQGAALFGIAPFGDSGQHRGGRSIRGGRAQPRQLLYMAARPDPLRTFLQGRYDASPPPASSTRSPTSLSCAGSPACSTPSCARTAPGGPSRPPASWRPPRETAADQPPDPSRPGGFARLHGSSSPLCPANPLDTNTEAAGAPRSPAPAARTRPNPAHAPAGSPPAGARPNPPTPARTPAPGAAANTLAPNATHTLRPYPGPGTASAPAARSLPAPAGLAAARTRRPPGSAAAGFAAGTPGRGSRSVR